MALLFTTLHSLNGRGLPIGSRSIFKLTPINIMIKRERVLVFIGLFLCTFHVYGQKVAVKTNLVADATTTINLATEIGLTAKTTLDLYVNYNPWSLGSNKLFKHVMLQPEYRYWFCERFSGSFIGVHAHAGIFNAGGIDLPFGVWPNLKDYRYEGEFIGAGVSYGYQWVLGKHWNLEGNIGVGYAYVNFDKYRCKNCGKLQEKDGHKNYFGPTKAAVSLIYLF